MLWYLIVILVVIFLINDVEHLFTLLFAIHISSFVSPLQLFKNLVVFFPLLSCKNSLHILDITFIRYMFIILIYGQNIFHTKKSLYTFKIEKNFSYTFSRSVTILAFTFRSIIHFEFIFVCEVKIKVHIFLQIDIEFLLNLFKNDLICY